MVRGGGARGGTSGSVAGGLAAVAEIEGADDAPASPSSSPAAARQEHLQQHMLAAHTQLAQLFPGGLPQPQAALQAYPTLVGGNAPQPPSADLASVLAALSQLDGRLSTSFKPTVVSLALGLPQSRARARRCCRMISSTSPPS